MRVRVRVSLSLSFNTDTLAAPRANSYVFERPSSSFSLSLSQSQDVILKPFSVCACCLATLNAYLGLHGPFFQSGQTQTGVKKTKAK